LALRSGRISPVFALRPSVSGPQQGQPLYPLQHRPEMSPYAGKSEIVHINNPLMLNRREPLGWEKSSVGTPSHNSFNSSSKGRMNTSIFPSWGERLPEIKMHSEMKNFLVTNQGSRLYIKINTGQVD
jgi:hypothetical protein